MKKKITFILIFMVCLFLAGCGDNNPVPQPYPDVYKVVSKSFIAVLDQIDYVDVEFPSEKYDGKYYISFQLKCYDSNIGNSVSILSTGHEKEVFDSLMTVFGDTAYNQEHYYEDYDTHPDALNFPVFTNKFCHAHLQQVTSLDVTSDTDWDDVHPAGTSLNDIITFSSNTPKYYIQNGYQGELSFDYNDSFSWQTMPLSEMEENDFHLTMNYFVQRISGNDTYLFFDSEPTSEKNHTITVTLHLDDGRTIQDSVDCSFE